jgi:hypothetical protein
MKEGMFWKGLVFGVIVLFIGVAVQPGISSNIKQEEKTNVDPKDYLFQTILDISNNPKVKELFEQYKDDWKNNNPIGLNSEYRNVFFKLLVKNPKLFFSPLFTTPVDSYEYIESAYDTGCKIINTIGEDKAIQIIESVKFANPEIFDKLTTIIMNNAELSNRITTLTELNENESIICVFLHMIWLGLLFYIMILSVYAEQFPEWGIIYKILFFHASRIFKKMENIVLLMEYFGCDVNFL